MTIDSDGQHTYEDSDEIAWLNFCNILIVWCWVLEHLKNLSFYVVNLEIYWQETSWGLWQVWTFLIRKRDFVWFLCHIAKTLNRGGWTVEFEMNMLLECKKRQYSDLWSWHCNDLFGWKSVVAFYVIRDSIFRIYKVFFKYIFSSLFSFLVDIVAFTILIFV